MELANRFITPGILFLLTLAFGFWLSHAGKPYNGILFNVHKLIALGAVVLAGIQFYKMLHTFDGLLVVLLFLLALCVIALFASGALMSAGKLDYALMLTIHRIAPLVLAVGFGLVMIFLKSSP
jgi:predicted CDP-diglyceride synthetase/phosphatidate cytidylyltransferase